MGCNCKNKKTEAQQITKEVTQKVQVVRSVTLEEINIIENMVPDINSNAEKRAYVTEFFMRNYGDPVITYCDQVCQKRLKDRLRLLKKSI
jgi:hypothetical protein